MDQQAQSDAALIDAASAINDLTHYLARNVLGKGRPSAAHEFQLMEQVHQRLHAVAFTMLQLHRDKHAAERLAKSDRDVLGMTDYVRRIGPDIEVATLAHEAKQLRDVLAEILLSTKTRNWFWKALDEQFAMPVTTMSGLKHSEAWSTVLKKSLIGIGYGLGGLGPPEFDKMQVADDPGAAFRTPTARWLFAVRAGDRAIESRAD